MQGNMLSYEHRSDTAMSQAVLTRTGTMSGRRTEMCSIFDVYYKCVRKGMESDDRSMVAIRTMDSLPHKHQSPSLDLAITLLTPTNVP